MLNVYDTWPLCVEEAFDVFKVVVVEIIFGTSTFGPFGVSTEPTYLLQAAPRHPACENTHVVISPESPANWRNKRCVLTTLKSLTVTH